MRRRLSIFSQRFRRDEHGSALVEMTLIAPLMIALSAGVFEFGNLIHQKLLIEAGLRDGARYASRCNSQMYSDYGFAAIDCAANAENIALYGNIADTGTVRVPGLTADNITIDIANLVDCENAVDGAGVTQYRSVTPLVCIVRASSTFDYPGVGLLDLLGIGPITLNGVHEERIIRF
ncbi:TadE/TadG family type IV pilus assembly protein [Mesorhizobium sp. ZC-5]|uniref:TadE/TadG family type IV pilus assembly protein n=1 Tax=Mesorhizobium sp. ZC-5 TaxID=2986066 RepID=UPI0021E98168|nr:TadE/TadG family type IV pilus assembly protein [Mesorhizobium sp. ZC-5]MCV3240678.1 pilus assembly protein [Mesorhizobium sp. ZC-5]